MHIAVLLAVICWITGCLPAAHAHELSPERVVFQTKFGDLELATWPKASEQLPPPLQGVLQRRTCWPLNPPSLPLQVAPVTSAHILKIAMVRRFQRCV